MSLSRKATRFEIVILREVYGLSVKEIASKLECSTTSIYDKYIREVTGKQPGYAVEAQKRYLQTDKGRAKVVRSNKSKSHMRAVSRWAYRHNKEKGII